MIHPIVIYGDPVLRAPFQPVEQFDQHLHTLANDMLETMRDADGIGLAAQQIGQTLGICVVDVPTDMDTDEANQPLNPNVAMPLVLINPEVTATSGKPEPCNEGCLSFPGITGRVERHHSASIRYQDLNGTPHELTAHGLLARCIMHEIDHLNGVLFIDHMSQVKRLALKGKLKRLRQG